MYQYGKFSRTVDFYEQISGYFGFYKLSICIVGMFKISFKFFTQFCFKLVISVNYLTTSSTAFRRLIFNFSCLLFFLANVTLKFAIYVSSAHVPHPPQWSVQYSISQTVIMSQGTRQHRSSIFPSKITNSLLFVLMEISFRTPYYSHLINRCKHAKITNRWNICLQCQKLAQSARRLVIKNLDRRDWNATQKREILNKAISHW